MKTNSPDNLVENKAEESDPLISVVVPCFKCSKTIRQTVASIKRQKYDNIELILVNGKDDDPETKKAILEATSDFPKERLQLFFLETNLGPGNNRNVGIEHAKGEYIALLDSDDCIQPDRLSDDIHYLKSLNCDMVCSFLTNQHDFRRKRDSKPKRITFWWNILKNRIHVSTVVAKNENWFRFDSRMLIYAEDIFLWQKLLSQKKLIYRLPEKKTDNGISPTQMTQSKKKEMHASNLRMFALLKQNKNIDFFQYVFLRSFENAKYILRTMKK